MEVNLQHEDLLIKLRGKLNEDKIKLWEPPFISQGNDISKSLLELAEKYSKALSINQEIIAEALKELQTHSVERSRANSQFSESGVATIRIRISLPGQKPGIVNIKKTLNAETEELFQELSSEIKIERSRIKLIFNGKVIKAQDTLEKQGVKNGSQLMALILSESIEEIQREDALYLEMKATKHDALLLALQDDTEEFEYIALEDQSGKAVNVPKKTKRQLLVGLALHERGKTALAEKNYPLALILLLEADQQFSECSNKIIKLIDNWASIQLDIAWCYLCLQSLSAASDVAGRLAHAQHALDKSYGGNMERAIAVTGSGADERVLVMRLYLLQGILSYHQNKREEAKQFLDKAEKELNSLKVDESAVATIMTLGWSRAEAFSALRATQNDISLAANRLQAMAVVHHTERERSEQDRKRRALGLCLDGSPVDRTLVTGLLEMGFSYSKATVALRNTNNHVAEAVRLIEEQPEIFEYDSDSSDESMMEADSILLDQLQGMGYDSTLAKKALKKCKNDIADAIEYMLQHMPMPTGDDALVAASEGNPSTSHATDAGEDKNKDKKAKLKRKLKIERKEAFERLVNGIHSEKNRHLDTDLNEEEQFLVQYKSLL